MTKVKSLGRRQVVRQLVLVQPFRGSNPFAPVLDYSSFVTTEREKVKQEANFATEKDLATAKAVTMLRCSDAQERMERE